jgi:hypothetical protein
MAQAVGIELSGAKAPAGRKTLVPNDSVAPMGLVVRRTRHPRLTPMGYTLSPLPGRTECHASNDDYGSGRSLNSKGISIS